MSSNDFAGMVPKSYASVDMTYDGSNLMTTAVFKDEDGDILVTLTFTYDGSDNLTNVTKS